MDLKMVRTWCPLAFLTLGQKHCQLFHAFVPIFVLRMRQTEYYTKHDNITFCVTLVEKCKTLATGPVDDLLIDGSSNILVPD